MAIAFGKCIASIANINIGLSHAESHRKGYEECIYTYIHTHLQDN